MSNEFYEDEDKITFDEAEMLVDRYLRRQDNGTVYVECTQVAREFNVEESHHNLLRIRETLKKKSNAEGTERLGKHMLFKIE